MEITHLQSSNEDGYSSPDGNLSVSSGWKSPNDDLGSSIDGNSPKERMFSSTSIDDYSSHDDHLRFNDRKVSIFYSFNTFIILVLYHMW